MITKTGSPAIRVKGRPNGRTVFTRQPLQRAAARRSLGAKLTASRKVRESPFSIDKNNTDLYRVGVGDWHITYAIKDAELIVLVVEVAPRGGAYRGL
jgi:mRNA-degrading endonuclease RelE of RelBE toxin-antitoxin system